MFKFYYQTVKECHNEQTYQNWYPQWVNSLMVLKNQLRWKRLNAQVTQRIYLKSTQECGTKDCGPKECRIKVSEFIFKWAQSFTYFYYAFFQIFEYFPIFSYTFSNKLKTICVLNFFKFKSSLKLVLVREIYRGTMKP